MPITLALRIAEWRKFRGLQQYQLAALAEITRPRLSDIERNRAEPSPKRLQRIAKALDCTVSQLYDDPQAKRDRVFEFAVGMCSCDSHNDEGVPKPYMFALTEDGLLYHCKVCDMNRLAREVEPKTDADD